MLSLPSDVICEGWLLKRGAAASTAFRRRWFVLTRGGTMLYRSTAPPVEQISSSNTSNSSSNNRCTTKANWLGQVPLTAHTSVQDTSVCPVSTGLHHRVSGPNSNRQLGQQALHAAWHAVACSFQLQSKSDPRVWFLSAESPELRQRWVSAIKSVLEHLCRDAKGFVLRVLAVRPKLLPSASASNESDASADNGSELQMVSSSSVPNGGAAHGQLRECRFLAQLMQERRELLVQCTLGRTDALPPDVVFCGPPAIVAGSPPVLEYDLRPSAGAPTFEILDGRLSGDAALNFSIVRSRRSLSTALFGGTQHVEAATGRICLHLAGAQLVDGVEAIFSLPLRSPSTQVELDAELLVGVTSHSDPLALHSINIRTEYPTTQDYFIERTRVYGQRNSDLIAQTFVRQASYAATMVSSVVPAAHSAPILQVAVYEGSVASNGRRYIEVMDEYRNVIYSFCLLKTSQSCTEWFVCRGAIGGSRVATLVKACDADDDDDDDDDDDCDAVIYMLSNPLDADEVTFHGSTIEIDRCSDTKTTLTRCVQLAGLGMDSLAETASAARRHEEIEIAVFEQAKLAVAPQEDVALILAIEEGFRHCVHDC